MERFKRFVPDNWFNLLFPALFILISLILIIVNGSFVFERVYISTYGDQTHYYSLAYKLLHFQVEKSYYTMGYSLLYLPLMLVTGVQAHWSSIMPLLIPLQSFVLMPVTIYFIFRNKTRKFALVTLMLLAVYYFGWLFSSADILIKYNFFGLIPLSEPLSIFLIIMPYHVYTKYFITKDPDIRFSILLAFLIGWGLLTRNVAAILYMPLFADMALTGRVKQLLQIGIGAGLVYAPQLLYNYLCSKEIFFNGYVWKASTRVDKNTKVIEALYGIKSASLFSIRYAKVNITDLFVRYLPTLALAAYLLYKRPNRLTILVVIFSIINILFFLTYWWSKASGLMDRFLLPNVLLLLFMFKNTMLDEKSYSNIKIHFFGRRWL